MQLAFAGPRRDDPRLHLAAVIISLQVLGQIALGFEVSVAQILVAIGTCAALELAVTWRRSRVVAWPASALLTGNGVAFILRVPGTRHGDWWSLHGAWIFAATAAVALLSKYVIRAGGHHVFNPSNIGLVACFVILGSRRVDPQDLWWGPTSPALALTFAVIIVGGLTVVGRLRMVGLAAAFWAAFAGSSAVTALSGHCITARWHVGPVCGTSYWRTVVASPEILVFLFFMITDPRTTPSGRTPRAVFGAAVGLSAAVLAAPAHTEFATKVGILAALAAVCAFRPLVDFLPAAARRPGLLVGSFGLVSAGLLTAGGSGARPAPAPSDPPPNDADLPAVTVSAAVRAADPALAGSGAQTIAAFLAADLRIGAAGVSTGDVAMVRTAFTGSAELELLAGGAGRILIGPQFRIDKITAAVISDPANPQAPARIGLRVRAHGPDGSLERTFVMTPAGSGYRVAEVL